MRKELIPPGKPLDTAAVVDTRAAALGAGAPSQVRTDPYVPRQVRLVGVVVAAVRCWADVAEFRGAAGGCDARWWVAMVPGQTGTVSFGLSLLEGNETGAGKGGLPELCGCEVLPAGWAPLGGRALERDLGRLTRLREIGCDVILGWRCV